MQTRSRAKHHVFLACLNCHLSVPTVLDPPSCSESATGAETDCFLRDHAGHSVTRLERYDLRLSAEQNWWRRSSGASFALTDGKQLFLVEAERVRAQGESQYRLRPATLHAREPKLAVDEETIRRGLVSALFPYRLRSTKFRRFMEALQDVIGRLSENQLDLVFEDTDDPSLAIARMPDCAYAELERLTPSLFDPWELPRIEQFLARDRDQESLLSLRVRREIAALDA